LQEFLYLQTKSRPHLLATEPIDRLVVGKFYDFDHNYSLVKKFLETHKNRLICGYFSYDLHVNKQSVLPKFYLLAFDKYKKSDAAQLNQFNLPKHFKLDETSHNFKPEITESQYHQSYQKIKDYIQSGDVYQINLTHRLHAQADISPKTLFDKVAEKNQVDFLAYFHTPDFQIISASPERFIQVKDGLIKTCPIKGTRRRDLENAKNDIKMSEDLLDSPKEAAELNMITDLLRNDLGMVSKVGSVKVKKHRELQKCPTVWHTFSEIEGVLKEDLHPVLALMKMLPGGSISGCPKKRATEIIEELEFCNREAYTGVLFYYDPENNYLDSSILIRTILKQGKDHYLQVGGGIVLDSSEEAEFQETLDKAKSFMSILC
jgi:para-aminobenzoate synthetase component 1